MGVYFDVIKRALIMFPVLACLFTMPYVVYNYHKYGSVWSLRILVIYSFILYLLCAYFLVILPLPSKETVAAMTGPRAQLIPFHFFCDIIKESDFVLTKPRSWITLVYNRALFQVVFNVIMTVPFGVYLRYYFRCGLKKTLLASFLLSLFFELTQLSGLYFIYPRGYRLFDVDDLMTNTLGGVLGFFMVTPFLRVLPTREKMDRDSFRRGQEVSLARRLMAFFIDLPCAGLFAVIAFAVLSFLGKSRLMPFFIAYFILSPILLRGASIGKKIMRIRIITEEGEEPCWLQYVIRYGSLWAVWYLFPSLSTRLVNVWVAFVGFGAVKAAVLYGLVSIGYCLFLLLEGVKLAQHRPLFYEKLSGTKVVSIIKIDTP